VVTICDGNGKKEGRGKFIQSSCFIDIGTENATGTKAERSGNG